jgi:hypothetical protein
VLNRMKNVRFEGLVSMSMKMAVCWDVVQCSLKDTDRRFKSFYYFLILFPAKVPSQKWSPWLRTEVVIMCCFVWAIAHLMGWWQMNIEQWWNDTGRGIRRNRRKTCPSTTLSSTKPTWIDPGANPGLRGEEQRLTVWAMARPFRCLLPLKSFWLRW